MESSTEKRSPRAQVTREPHEVHAIGQARRSIRALRALHIAEPQAATPTEALETMQDWLRSYLMETAGAEIACPRRCDGLFSECELCLGAGLI